MPQTPPHLNQTPQVHHRWCRVEPQIASFWYHFPSPEKLPLFLSPASGIWGVVQCYMGIPKSMREGRGWWKQLSRGEEGWRVVVGGGWRLGCWCHFSREWERWEATSIFFFFAWEDLKFCGSSKEGCGWAGHILTNQSCALVWVSWLDLTHDPNGSSFIYLPFFCFP